MQSQSTSLNAHLMRRNAQQRRSSLRKEGMGVFSTLVYFVLLLVVLGLLYLTQATKTNIYGFELNELQAEKSRLIEENQSLKIESARLKSLQRANASDVAENYTQDAPVVYK